VDEGPSVRLADERSALAARGGVGQGRFGCLVESNGQAARGRTRLMKQATATTEVAL